MTSVAAARSDGLEPIYEEVGRYVLDAKLLAELDPDAAMRWISATSARILELTLQSLRQDSRANQRLRLEWLNPVRDELRFQFQIASRRHAINSLEWEQAR